MKNEQAYRELIEAIIESKIKALGPLALNKIKSVEGIKFDSDGKIISLSNNSIEVIQNILKKYEELAGKVSTLTAKVAILKIIIKYPDLELPSELKS